MYEYTDILVVGGGLIGYSLALALKNYAKITLLETHAADFSISDQRTIVLSFGTKLIFEALDVWKLLAPYTTSIQNIHVSQAGGLGSTQFSAQENRVEALGYVICAEKLSVLLKQSALNVAALTPLFSSTLHTLQAFPEGYRVQIKTPTGSRHFITPLLIGADGTYSQTRVQLGIGAQEKMLHQTALTAHVTLKKPHKHIAYERITPEGVLAALPLNTHQMGIILTTETLKAHRLHAVEDAVFLDHLNKMLRGYLSAFTDIQHRSVYALKEVYARQQSTHHAVLLGNAAQTLHPIAAQGFNLGLQNVCALTQTIIDGLAHKKNIGDASILKLYTQSQRLTQKHTIMLTRTLANVFSTGVSPFARNSLPDGDSKGEKRDSPFWSPSARTCFVQAKSCQERDSLLRNSCSKQYCLHRSILQAALIGLEMLPFIKQRLSAQAMGVRHALPIPITRRC